MVRRASSPLDPQAALSARVSEHLDEPVEAVSAFSRRGEAADIPEQFILAVTPTRLRILDHPLDLTGSGHRPIGPEVASFERDAVRVSARPGGPLTLDVTILSGRRRVDCRCAASRVADSVLDRLRPGVPSAA
jgi:hypothetical protein